MKKILCKRAVKISKTQVIFIFYKSLNFIFMTFFKCKIIIFSLNGFSYFAVIQKKLISEIIWESFKIPKLITIILFYEFIYTCQY